MIADKGKIESVMLACPLAAVSCNSSIRFAYISISASLPVN